ncbi:MAG: hypothetical protein NVSMB19_13640 [Vulcanimicrobiaceae bacterium]
MRLLPFRRSLLALAGLAVALNGCQGNIGSGSGLGIPAAPQYNQPAGPGGASGQSRQRAVDGAVYLTPEMATLPLPALNGFAVTLQLGTPPPSPSPSPSPSAAASATSTLRPGTRRTKMRAVASPSPAPSPTPAASGVPASSATGLASASPAPSGSGAPAGGPPSAVPSPKGSGLGSKTVTKLVVYPDDAPGVPTPQPSGNVQTFAVRKALVRGYIKPGADVALYGLGAVKFTIPADEDTAQRGYTVAIFAAGRRHHDTVLATDPAASVSAHVVASSAVDGLVLKKSVSYLLVLYADELAATPGPVPSGYPSPGMNPFVTPVPGGLATPVSGTPGGPGRVGAPYPPASTPPYPH